MQTLQENIREGVCLIMSNHIQGGSAERPRERGGHEGGGGGEQTSRTGEQCERRNTETNLNCLGGAQVKKTNTLCISTWNSQQVEEAKRRSEQEAREADEKEKARQVRGGGVKLV